jgi:hypothetical protein
LDRPVLGVRIVRRKTGRGGISNGYPVGHRHRRHMFCGANRTVPTRNPAYRAQVVAKEWRDQTGRFGVGQSMERSDRRAGIRRHEWRNGAKGCVPSNSRWRHHSGRIRAAHIWPSRGRMCSRRPSRPPRCSARIRTPPWQHVRRGLRESLRLLPSGKHWPGCGPASGMGMETVRGVSSDALTEWGRRDRAWRIRGGCRPAGPCGTQARTSQAKKRLPATKYGQRHSKKMAALIARRIQSPPRPLTKKCSTSCLTMRAILPPSNHSNTATHLHQAHPTHPTSRQATSQQQSNQPQHPLVCKPYPSSDPSRHSILLYASCIAEAIQASGASSCVCVCVPPAKWFDTTRAKIEQLVAGAWTVACGTGLGGVDFDLWCIQLSPMDVRPASRPCNAGATGSSDNRSEFGACVKLHRHIGNCHVRIGMAW